MKVIIFYVNNYIMKKVNFFNFTNYNIEINKISGSICNLKKNNNGFFSRVNFSPWCNSINLLKEKLSIKITFRNDINYVKNKAS